MKNYLFCACFFVYCTVCVSTVLCGTDTQGNYTLTVSQGNPNVSDVPHINENITTKFDISLIETVDNREEDASKKTNSQTYTVTVSGEQFIIKKVEKGSFNISKDKLSATRNNGIFMNTVTPIVWAEAPGDKTVTLSVSVTMKDGTTLSAEETINFTVPDFNFSVYVLDGKPGRKGSYNITIAGSNTAKINLGHAMWGVGVVGAVQADISNNLMAVANKPWGFCGPDIDTEILISAQNTTSGGNFEAITKGELNNDGVGAEVKRFEIKTKALAEKALKYISDEKRTPKDYKIPSYNCADGCLAALANSGLKSPDCKIKTSFHFYGGGRQVHKKWDIEISDPRELKRKLAEK